MQCLSKGVLSCLKQQLKQQVIRGVGADTIGGISIGLHQVSLMGNGTLNHNNIERAQQTPVEMN